MLERKIEKEIVDYFKTSINEPILVIEGARQIGKSYIINYLGNKFYKNFISINFAEDKSGKKEFADIGSKEDFYFALSGYAGAKNKLVNDEPVLIFIDEIQEYPQYLTLLKFLKEDKKYKFICSGSLLGITLKKTVSIPIGSAHIIHMYPLDFEEFLWANGVNKTFIETLYKYFKSLKSLPQSQHKLLLDYFKKYALIGGMPQAVQTFIEQNNIQKVRQIHTSIYDFYEDDASKYDLENKLKIKKVYEYIPSLLENVKKRMITKNIENHNWACFNDYLDEYDYLISSGIVTEVKSISNPVLPLLKSTWKNLIKFYLNDVGLLSNLFFECEIKPIMDERESINIGSIYECIIANELKAHGFKLYYYDNKAKGEVDFLIDDYSNLSVLPIEVKSGKNYYVHSALNNLLSCKEYDIKKAYVLNNKREITQKADIIYLPIYFCMFIEKTRNGKFDQFTFEEVKKTILSYADE